MPGAWRVRSWRWRPYWRGGRGVRRWYGGGGDTWATLDGHWRNTCSDQYWEGDGCWEEDHRDGAEGELGAGWRADRCRSRSPHRRSWWSSQVRRQPMDVRSVALFGNRTLTNLVFPRGSGESVELLPRRPGRRPVVARWFTKMGGTDTRFTGARLEDWRSLFWAVVELSRQPPSVSPHFAVIWVSAWALMYNDVLILQEDEDKDPYLRSNHKEAAQRVKTGMERFLETMRVLMPHMCPLILSVLPPLLCSTKVLAELRNLSASLWAIAKKNDVLFVDVEAVIRRAAETNSPAARSEPAKPRPAVSVVRSAASPQPSGRRPVTEDRLMQLGQQLRQELRQDILQVLRQEIQVERREETRFRPSRTAAPDAAPPAEVLTVDISDDEMAEPVQLGSSASSSAIVDMTEASAPNPATSGETRPSSSVQINPSEAVFSPSNSTNSDEAGPSISVTLGDGATSAPTITTTKPPTFATPLIVLTDATATPTTTLHEEEVKMFVPVSVKPSPKEVGPAVGDVPWVSGWVPGQPPPISRSAPPLPPLAYEDICEGNGVRLSEWACSAIRAELAKIVSM